MDERMRALFFRDYGIEMDNLPRGNPVFSLETPSPTHTMPCFSEFSAVLNERR